MKIKKKQIYEMNSTRYTFYSSQIYLSTFDRNVDFSSGRRFLLFSYRYAITKKTAMLEIRSITERCDTHFGDSRQPSKC